MKTVSQLLDELVVVSSVARSHSVQIKNLKTKNGITFSMSSAADARDTGQFLKDAIQAFIKLAKQAEAQAILETCSDGQVPVSDVPSAGVQPEDSGVDLDASEITESDGAEASASLN